MLELNIPPPLIPEVSGPEEFPALAGAPFSLIGVQKGLLLTDRVTVVTYCASVRVASLLERANRKNATPLRECMLEKGVEGEVLRERY